MPKKAIIIGAGPAGLTAALELLKRTDIIPIVLEKSGEIGGISRTIEYKGNRMDMGPHRFFSKSDRVMDWWLSIMPLRTAADENPTITYQNKFREVKSAGSTAKDPDKAMLLIQRLTRIYFLRKFFAYPIQLSFDTLRTLGFIRTIKILFSFLWIRLFPRKPEKSLEDFIMNKFGKQLYHLFFKDYTEKVWGIAPSHISAEWGAQRIKGVSLSKAIAQAVRNMRKKKSKDIGQKETETSLIEQFLYPKHGPGSLWEEVARQIEEKGGSVYLHQDVQKIYLSENQVQSVITINSQTGQAGGWEGDYFFSTMPVQELITGMGKDVPLEVREVAAGLLYRDFINVGILLKQLSTKEGKHLELKDNWIYIQERDVKVGRLMIYNNWGGGMIKDPNTTWIGMEYFCNKTDALWAQPDTVIRRLAIDELIKMDLARPEDVLDSTVQRMEKTYPAYFGTYDRFEVIRNYTDGFENLFLIGRNGMHKYNNSDHSSLCAMVAVDNIVAGVTSKANLWAINTEQEYHEERSANHSIETTAPEPRVAPSFIPEFLWRNKVNRAWWIAALASFLIQFIIFKYNYPFANYMPDSYSYLEAAASNVDVNMWPVAYSKLLRLISVLTHSDTIVVGFQYLFLQSATLLFLFSLLFLQPPGKRTKTLLLLFVLLDPISLYIANYISADAIFIGLSLLWLTSLLWIIYRPSRWQIPIHAILLLTCFIVRYNAIYYPLISILAFIMSRQPWQRKSLGIALSMVLVMASLGYTIQKMKDITGQQQFSAFGGWQLANNALYMYEHIPASSRGPVPTRYAGLEKTVRQHMDTLARVKSSHDDSLYNIFYLWSSRGPLIHYMEQNYKKDSTTSYFGRWASEGPLYTQYALYLIRKFPMAYLEYFVLPNAYKYAVPPTEFLGQYNMGGDSVGKIAKDWFNYKDYRLLKHLGPVKRADLSQIYLFSAFNLICNLSFLLLAGALVAFGNLKKHDVKMYHCTLLFLGFWACNLLFSIGAAPVVLRYQYLPMLVYALYSGIATKSIVKLDSIK